MANTQKYINHLLQSTGITPACSEEERLAAEDIAQIFRDHGLDPEVQEFNAPASSKMGYAVMGVLAFIGSLFMGIGGAVGLLGTLLAIVAAVLYGLDRSGHPLLSRIGQTGVSQNVVAYHKASGPLASPRNRPVVVVAHYDSPRAELLTRPQLAPYRTLIAKLMPVGMFAPAAVAIVRILPLPGVLKVLLWIAAIVLSLVPLLSAANIIANRFFLPYTSGSVCNKSSVAAMLGVMDAVAPYEGEDEFPQDTPFDQYFGEQKRRAAEAAQAAAEAAAAKERRDYGNQVQYDEPSYSDEDYESDYAAQTGRETDVADTYGEVPAGSTVTAEPTPVVDEVPAAAEAIAEPAPAVAEPEPELYRNAAGNVRFGSEAIRSLGMLPESCKIEYDEGQEPVVPEPVAPKAPAPAAPAPAAPAAPATTAVPAASAPAVEPKVEPAAPTAAAPVASAPRPDSTVQMTVPPAVRAGAEEDAKTDARAAQAQKTPDDPSFDPFAYHPIADEEEDSEPLPALSEQDDGEAADERVYEAPRVTYDSDSDYAGATDSPRAEIASTLSAFGSKTSKFFKGAFAKGKKLVDDFEAQRAAAREEAEAEALAEQEREEAERAAAAKAAENAAPVDSTTTFKAVSVEETETFDPSTGEVDSTTTFEARETVDDDSRDSADEPIEVDADVEDADDNRYESTAASVPSAAPAASASEVAPGPVRPVPTTPTAPEVQPVDKTIQAEPIAAPATKPVISQPASHAHESAAAPAVSAVPVAAPVPASSPSATVEMPAEAQTDKTQQVQKPYSTQIFTMPAADDKDSTMVQPAKPAGSKAPETVDSLMAEISSQIKPHKRVNFKAPAPEATATMPPQSSKPSTSGLRSVPDPSLPSMSQASPTSRTSLFDLPDPSASSSDPFATRETPATKVSSAPADIPVISASDEPAVEPIETISAPAAPQPKKKHGLGDLFGHKKKGEQSMSDWLGVEDDYDAKNSGRGIGSWDNFEDDDDGWKGGATSSEGATPEEMTSAVASMGDDELLGHDIWFVATGASDRDGAGMKAFLASHRDKLRGVFFINLESVGAGQISVVTTEGEHRVLKGDRRIMNLVNKVCATFHVSCGQLAMPYASTDAYVALESSRRALTIAGADGTGLACTRTEEDQPHNVDPSNIAMVSEIVTEVIRRS